jgi:hypothetical protein
MMSVILAEVSFSEAVYTGVAYLVGGFLKKGEDAARTGTV